MNWPSHSNYSADSLKESDAGGPASIITAYADKENATSPQGDKSLVWPIATPAEFAESRRPAIFTAATFLSCFWLR